MKASLFFCRVLVAFSASASQLSIDSSSKQQFVLLFTSWTVNLALLPRELEYLFGMAFRSLRQIFPQWILL